MKQFTIEPLNIDYTIFFKGTDEEAEAAEKKEEARAAYFESIIFSDTFRAMSYYNESGQRRILHHSTRKGVEYQLSYIDRDGIPAMHENYIMSDDNHVDEAIHTKHELLHHFVSATNYRQVVFTLL